MQLAESDLSAAPALNVANSLSRTDGPEPVSDCPHAFLAPIAHWPNLNLAFFDRSRDLLLRQGEGEWKAQGGKLASRTNMATFGNPSPIAAEILAQVVAQSDGFNCTDETGRMWCARLNKEDESDALHWTGTAIGGDAMRFLLTRLERQKCAAELRQLLAKRNMFGRSGSPEECQLQKEIFGLVKQIRLLDGAPRMLPTLMRAATAGGSCEMLVPIDILAKELFSPQRFRSSSISALDVYDGLRLLSKIKVRRMTLPKSGWAFHHVSEASALPAVDWHGDSLRIKMNPDFHEFLRPCFSAEYVHVADKPASQSPSLFRERTMIQQAQPVAMGNPAPQMAPALPAASDAPRPPRPDVRPEPLPRVAPKRKSSPKPESLERALARCFQEARVIDQALPALTLHAMAGEAARNMISPGGFEAFLKKLLADSGNPSDPLVKMAIQQLAWAHARVGQLHVDAASAKTPELRAALTLAAARLMAEHRKSMLALSEYRCATAPPETVQAKQQDVVAQANGHPKKQEEKNGDTKQGTKQSRTNHAEAPVPPSNRSPRKPRKETRTNARGPRKAPTRRFEEQALGAIIGSHIGKG